MAHDEEIHAERQMYFVVGLHDACNGDDNAVSVAGRVGVGNVSTRFWKKECINVSDAADVPGVACEVTTTKYRPLLDN